MQIFPKTLNILPIALALVTNVAGAAVTGVVWYYLSPKNFQVGYGPQQPVPYSHRLHAGQLGMDCRYCHANVESSAEAMIPPTQTCMGCHTLVKAQSPRLQVVRDSWASGEPIEWVRVHKLADHAYFNHAAHLNAGVGCTSCHGRIDQMEVVAVAEPLGMGWCLECHRNPGPHLRPLDQITNMAWEQTASEDEIQALAANVHPPENCSGCHR
jgi:Cytochrome c7 and related cytochrome c